MQHEFSVDVLRGDPSEKLTLELRTATPKYKDNPYSEPAPLTTETQTGNIAYLRAGSFMENWLGALDHIRATGEMPFFYAPLDCKFPLVATQDIGLAGAKVLGGKLDWLACSGGGWAQGETDLHQAAAGFGKALGRVVKAIQLPEAAWQTVLEGMGMPPDRTALYIEMVKSFNSGWIHFGNPGTERFHGPTTIEEFAQERVR
jgi:uncharacterized protein YbjT (DUF2867 family)